MKAQGKLSFFRKRERKKFQRMGKFFWQDTSFAVREFLAIRVKLSL
jgi:hypothetical protein